MNLLPPYVRRQLPALNSTKKTGHKRVFVHLKYFFPLADWTWFVVEGEPIPGDFRFFGYQVGIQAEWTHFTLSELESVGTNNVSVERDFSFEPGRFADIIEKFREERGY